MGTGHKEGGKFHPHTNSNNGMSSDKIEKKKAVNPNWKVNRDNEQHLSPDEIEKFMDLIIYDIVKMSSSRLPLSRVLHLCRVLFYNRHARIFKSA